MNNSQKFCTACQCMRDIDGGIVRKVRRTARWICKSCLERKSESIYKSKHKYSERQVEQMYKLFR